MKGVIDRFADNDLAVILIESISKEIHIPKKDLPKGSTVNTWFILKEAGDTYTIVSIDEEKTATATKKSERLAVQLHAKMKRSKYKND